MPFTPFHLGPILLIGLLLLLYLDLFALVVGAVILDIEPSYYLFFTNRGAFHGITHTLLVASLIALATSFIIYPFREKYTKLVEVFGLKQEVSYPKTLISLLIGTLSHVSLDMFLYPEMRPLYPLSGNPFFNAIPSPVIYEFCFVALIISIIIYVIRVITR